MYTYRCIAALNLYLLLLCVVNTLFTSEKGVLINKHRLLNHKMVAGTAPL